MSGVVYSIHVYDPLEFTSQGTDPLFPIGPQYPGVVKGVTWNKQKLAQTIAPAVDYSKRYRVQFYVGEFSAIRWAGGAAQYLSDATSLFEQYKWDWSYHAFREWQGWSLEYGSDPATVPEPAPTDRQKVIRTLYDKNDRS